MQKWKTFKPTHNTSLFVIECIQMEGGDQKCSREIRKQNKRPPITIITKQEEMPRPHQQTAGKV